MEIRFRPLSNREPFSVRRAEKREKREKKKEIKRTIEWRYKRDTASFPTLTVRHNNDNSNAMVDALASRAPGDPGRL